MQFLWDKFRVGNAKQIRQYFDVIAGENQTFAEKRDRFVQDIERMETLAGCKILPPTDSLAC